MLAVALLGFFAAWVWRGQPPVRSSILGTLEPIDALPPGKLSDATWSRDGSRLAVSASLGSDVKPHVYIVDSSDGAAPVRLTSSEMAEARPAWLPDGREIAFERFTDSSHFEIVRFNLVTTTNLSDLSSTIGQ